MQSCSLTLLSFSECNPVRASGNMLFFCSITVITMMPQIIENSCSTFTSFSVVRTSYCTRCYMDVSMYISQIFFLSFFTKIRANLAFGVASETRKYTKIAVFNSIRKFPYSEHPYL